MQSGTQKYLGILKKNKTKQTARKKPFKCNTGMSIMDIL